MSDVAFSGTRMRDQPDGGNQDLWGEYTDDNLTIIDRMFTQLESYTVSGDVTVSWTDYATDNVLQGANIKLTGPSGDDTLTATATITVPAYRASKNIYNKTGKDITFGVSGGTSVTIKNGFVARIAGDGTDYYVYSPSQFATGLYVNGQIKNMTAGTDNTDATTLAQVNSLIAAGAIPGAAGTVKVNVGATADYLGAVATADDGSVSLLVSGSTLDFSVSSSLQSDISDAATEILALTGTLTSIITSGVTVSGTPNRRYELQGNGQINLPAFTVNQWMIVEYTPDAGTTATVGRSGQTIDGTAEDDTYLGDGGVGPIILYNCVSNGAVDSKLIGSVP